MNHGVKPLLGFIGLTSFHLQFILFFRVFLDSFSYLIFHISCLYLFSFGILGFIHLIYIFFLFLVDIWFIFFLFFVINFDWYFFKPGVKPLLWFIWLICFISICLLFLKLIYICIFSWLFWKFCYSYLIDLISIHVLYLLSISSFLFCCCCGGTPPGRAGVESTMRFIIIVWPIHHHYDYDPTPCVCYQLEWYFMRAGEQLSDRPVRCCHIHLFEPSH